MRPDAALGARQPALGDVLAAAADVLACAEVPNPGGEAMWLWSGLTGVPASRVVLDRDEPIVNDLRMRFETFVRRRANGEPLAYVIGTAAFRTLELRVTRDTLIPRPETEGLVEHVLRWAASRETSAEYPRGLRPRAEGHLPSALEVGTGSGCIALSLAVEGRFRRIVATDASDRALAVARANRDAIAPPVRVEWRHGSLFQPIGTDERFDVIVSNPPYITNREFAALDPSVRAWEPRRALVAGPDGMDVISALLDGAATHLDPGGLLAIELDCRRAGRARDAAQARGWTDARVEPDLFGRARYLLATRPRAGS